MGSREAPHDVAQAAAAEARRTQPTHAGGPTSSLPELFVNDDAPNVCLNCMTPFPDESGIPTPIYDAAVAELGDPHQHGAAFDKGLAELDTYIHQVLHGERPIGGK